MGGASVLSLTVLTLIKSIRWDQLSCLTGGAVVKAWNHQVAGDLKSIGVFGLRDHQVKPTIKKSSDPKGCDMPDTKKSAQKPPG